MTSNIKNTVLVLKAGALIFIILVVLMFVYQNNLTKGYQVVDQNDYFENVVIRTERIRGATKITLENGYKYILPYAINYNYQIYDISRLVKEGDSLAKIRSSDTLIVKRYGDEYVFVIGKIIRTK